MLNFIGEGLRNFISPKLQKNKVGAQYLANNFADMKKSAAFSQKIRPNYSNNSIQKTLKANFANQMIDNTETWSRTNRLALHK